MPATRAAAARSRAARGDVKDPRVVARDLFDAAARHRTELVHAPFYGVQSVTFQTLAPTSSIHAKGGRATAVERGPLWLMLSQLDSLHPAVRKSLFRLIP